MAALTKLLPLPSDRMGSIWNLLALEDAYVVEYGPAGTTHFGIGPLSSLDIEPRGRYFVTHMDESDVIMGDSSRLERALVEVDQDHPAKHIFIVGSSLAATIGTDLEGIVFYLQDQVEADLHILDSGGFKGDMYRGMKDVYQLLADIVRSSHDQVESRAKPADLTYNILGASPDHYRVKSDLAEIKRVMNQALGLKLATSYVVNGRIDMLDQAGQANLSLVLRAEALPLAEALEEKFGVPYLLVDFYGYQGTKTIIQAVADLLGIDPEPGFMSDLAKRQARASLFRLSMSRSDRLLKLYSAGNPDLNRGLALAFAELGVEFKQQVNYQEGEKERIKGGLAWQSGLIFADSEVLYLADSSNHKILTSFPWLKHLPKATHLPIMGIRGMDWLDEKLRDYLADLD